MFFLIWPKYFAHQTVEAASEHTECSLIRLSVKTHCRLYTAVCLHRRIKWDVTASRHTIQYVYCAPDACDPQTCTVREHLFIHLYTRWKSFYSFEKILNDWVVLSVLLNSAVVCLNTELDTNRLNLMDTETNRSVCSVCGTGSFLLQFFMLDSTNSWLVCLSRRCVWLFYLVTR